MLLQKKFIHTTIKKFNDFLPQYLLDIEEKNRSNIFAWRGQFSPQLIENLLVAYCPRNATVLDPFSGSGTVLYESACAGLRAYGYEINPAAWILSRIYQLTNHKDTDRERSLQSINTKLKDYYPVPGIFDPPKFHIIDLNKFKTNLSQLYSQISFPEEIILDALIILLDLANNELTKMHLHNTFINLFKVIRILLFSEEPVSACLADARDMPLENNKIDFLITSPPYINVFNYHQNYRRSAEVLGWDLLKIAKSEIGSNRANRGNRFFTVIQYCLDMGAVLKEIQRVCKNNARIFFVVGHESRVLGAPFFNADIISDLALTSGSFDLGLRQIRKFKNKFGQIIREDLLHFLNLESSLTDNEWEEISRSVAHKVLSNALETVPPKNREALEVAINGIPEMKGTSFYNSNIKDHYRQPIHQS